MKRDEKNIEAALDRHLGLFSDPSSGQIDASRDRVLHRLMSGTAVPQALPVERRVRPILKTWTVLAAAAVVLLAVLVTASVVRKPQSRVMAETATGEPIDAQEIVRSNEAEGKVISLPDGSRIEMRAQSELVLEHAADGVRIRLDRGSVIVNAAKQRSGHLYVQTRDVTVTVVGTVFLVESAATGSRVAVIEGEVHVQQGTLSKKLFPGEQVTTTPAVKPAPVAQEISWSRYADSHLALLKQALLLPRVISPVIAPVIAPGIPTSAPQNVQPRSFVAASVTPYAPGPGRAGPPVLFGGIECSGNITLEPRRFLITNTSVYNLVSMAYGIDCRQARMMDLIAGVEDWVRTDRFDIDAVIPEGAPVYTKGQLNDREAPALQTMIQSLLEDRFRLSVHREVRDSRVFNLVVVREGKMTLSADQSPLQRSAQPRQTTPGVLITNDFFDTSKPMNRGMAGLVINTEGAGILRATAVGIGGILGFLQSQVGQRRVIDRTNLKGLYDIVVRFSPAERSVFLVALEEQLGLKLEPATIPVETVVVHRVERPAAN